MAEPGSRATAPVTAPLSPGVAYGRWAPRYEEETAISALEDRLVAALSPAPHSGRLLDAGCGTGRRSLGHGREAGAVGVDLVPDMLLAGRRRDPGRTAVAAADVRALPFPAALFDLLWLRLVIGHLPRIEPAYAELARVATAGARLVVSDFHPSAVAAGHRRTVPGGGEVVHHVHTLADHRSAADRAGWRLERVVESPAGPEERPYYERAGRLAQLERERDLPLVLVLVYRR